MQETHEVELFGNVRLAKPKFAFVSDDGQEIEATFNASEEEKILKALSGCDQTKVRLHGKAAFKPDGQIQQLVSIDTVELMPENSIKSYVSNSKPIWEQIEEIVQGVPVEILNNLPSDGASQHDRKLYRQGK